MNSDTEEDWKPPADGVGINSAMRGSPLGDVKTDLGGFESDEGDFLFKLNAVLIKNGIAKR